MARIWTVGHSTRSFAELVEILSAHGITCVADVRRFPASRRLPHFNREAFERDLGAQGIAYVWIPELGGRRSRLAGSPHTAWKVPAFAGYADHMDTPEWAAGVATLLARAEKGATAILCAEALYTQCHRRLIADALVARGHEVIHLVSVKRTEPHRLTPFARLEGERLIYDLGQLEL